MSGMAGKEVKNDLLENHGRKVGFFWLCGKRCIIRYSI
jgi:hypothetical protein